mmetsp:Transcript_12054/g.27033  ORF Transcript_12054/g.27033 Transcript_12054/m.27033 type:complete len:261 (+) Transcript_12054:1344-2126(+)
MPPISEVFNSLLDPRGSLLQHRDLFSTEVAVVRGDSGCHEEVPSRACNLTQHIPHRLYGPLMLFHEVLPGGADLQAEEEGAHLLEIVEVALQQMPRRAKTPNIEALPPSCVEIITHAVDFSVQSFNLVLPHVDGNRLLLATVIHGDEGEEPCNLPRRAGGLLSGVVHRSARIGQDEGQHGAEATHRGDAHDASHAAVEGPVHYWRQRYTWIGKGDHEEDRPTQRENLDVHVYVDPQHEEGHYHKVNARDYGIAVSEHRQD